MPEGNEDHGGVAMAVAIGAGGLDHRSTSASVRYSRARLSAFGRRRGGRCGLRGTTAPTGPADWLQEERWLLRLELSQ